MAIAIFVFMLAVNWNNRFSQAYMCHNFSKISKFTRCNQGLSCTYSNLNDKHPFSKALEVSNKSYVWPDVHS